MIHPTDWRKLASRCAEVTNDRPELSATNYIIKITLLAYDIRTPVSPILHAHNEYELIVFLNVDEPSSEKIGESVERGQTLLFSPYTQHTGHVADSPCSVFIVRFTMNPSLEIPAMDLWPVCPELADDAEKLMLLLLEASPGDLLQASAQLFTIVLHALSLVTPVNNPVKEVTQKIDLPEEIQKLVMNNPLRKWTLEDIASHFGMSVRHLSRLFHSETRDTVINHVLRCKLNIARSLLRESDNKISEVCFHAGIRDQAYFSRCFRKYFGVTPGEYRNMVRQSVEHAEEKKSPDHY